MFITRHGKEYCQFSILIAFVGPSSFMAIGLLIMAKLRVKLKVTSIDFIGVVEWMMPKSKGVFDNL